MSGEAHSLQAHLPNWPSPNSASTIKRTYDFDPGVIWLNDIARSLGDARKAQRLLDWKPKVRFPDIVARMLRGEREGPPAVS